MTAHHPPPPLTLTLLAAGTAAFFTLGVIQAMYGPAFTLFQDRYGVSTAGVGLIASAHFVGSALAPPLVGILLIRFSLRRVVVAALLTLALGVTLVALAPSWPLAIAGALLGGFGLGGVSGGLNAAYASIGTRAVNLVNAVFGLGSILSPLLVAGAGGNLALPFLTVAALCGLTLLSARVWGFPAMREQVLPPSPGRAGVQVGFFLALLACYVGLEVGFGAWAGRHLQSLGYASFAVIVAGYWGGMTVARVLTGLFGARVRPERLVLACAALTVGCGLAATQAALAPFAYILAGLALGPVFGTTLVWTTRSLPARWVPFLLTSGSVGGIVAPYVLGVLAAKFGQGAIPLALAALAAMLVAVVWGTLRVTRQAPSVRLTA
ncbi:MFS transporter [Deinococcus radiopugnans]|uniref:Fucose permease n=1 Tax=Deinococcus radiopugnans ATCC 19172 TaxID=585398 RepID=A0A5C4YAP7_9DEIO|nr:MFS transporter [Deinococcus radiopugnans]MBB6015675.1 fucose permease [Deinococcus radiopugnans ATCC 19172]TNM72631.1 MFS transporter [Deinococcus radiopugnans ATCC 19172]